MKYIPDQIQITSGYTNETDPLSPATGQHGDWFIDDDTLQLTYLGKEFFLSFVFW